MQWCCTLWRWIDTLGHWLFVSKCNTAIPLLSLSFAINSIFTGLSLSRFNLCTWMRKKAVKCIMVSDKFLAKVEQLSKNNETIRKKLRAFSDKAERYRVSFESGSLVWEQLRRCVTICCAIAAFVLVAFDVKTRIGMVLVFPYVLILLWHAIWVLGRVSSVISGRYRLEKAIDEAEKNGHDEFDLAECIKRIKGTRKALSTHEKPKKSGKTKKTDKS